MSIQLALFPERRGAEVSAIGRSRGGMSSKIHAVVDALGNSLRFILTPGQINNITQARGSFLDQQGL
jgi:hypothetical protein